MPWTLQPWVLASREILVKEDFFFPKKWESLGPGKKLVVFIEVFKADFQKAM